MFFRTAFKAFNPLNQAVVSFTDLPGNFLRFTVPLSIQDFKRGYGAVVIQLSVKVPNPQRNRNMVYTGRGLVTAYWT